jgi:hypothetical protein
MGGETSSNAVFGSPYDEETVVSHEAYESAHDKEVFSVRIRKYPAEPNKQYVQIGCVSDEYYTINFAERAEIDSYIGMLTRARDTVWPKLDGPAILQNIRKALTEPVLLSSENMVAVASDIMRHHGPVEDEDVTIIELHGEGRRLMLSEKLAVSIGLVGMGQIVFQFPPSEPKT